MIDRNLKAYARYDSANRIVSSSVVLRSKKPSGNFKEVPGYLCCNKIVTVVATPSGVYATTTTISINCGASQLVSIVSSSNLTPAQVVSALAPYTAVGTFSTDGTTVTLTAPICANAVFTIVKS